MAAIPPEAPPRSVRSRDEALRRLRKITRATAAAAVGLTGVFAALAASSFHGRKVVVSTRAQATAGAGQTARRSLATARPKHRAVAAETGEDGEHDDDGGSHGHEHADGASAPASRPAAAPTPAPAPAPAPAPNPAPVVVSGGS